MKENEKIKIETNAENNVNQQNSNSEVKPRNKKVTIVLVSVIVVLLIAIGVCAGLWFAGDTTKIINNKEEVVKEEEKNTSKKIDETKPWVYDAEYNKDKENKIVDDYYNFNKDVKVPYININSKDAEKVNNEIKNIYEEVYSKFGSNESHSYNGVKWDVQIIYYVEYEYYENDNILSVVLRVSDVVVNGGAGLSKLYTYNFNLDTLNVAIFEEMAKLCGFNSTSEVTDKISKWEKAQNDFAASHPDKVAAQMTGVVDGQYFIDSNRKLNFVYVSAAAGNYYTPTTVEPNKEIENFYDMSNVDESQAQKQEQVNENKTEEQILCEDFSFMSGLKNTVYETINKKEGERYFKISFDENSNPTIYIEDIGAQPYATYRRFYNVKSDVSVGSANVEFNYRTLNETGDFQTGNIIYSNVTNNDFIYLTMPETNGEMIKLYNLNVDYISQLYTKTIINEYGDSSKSAEVFGRQFIPITGIKGKESVYYIDENNDLYKMDLANLNKQILANYVRDIQIDQNNIIHAYPIGDSFMNNICQLDEFVVFEDIN